MTNQFAGEMDGFGHEKSQDAAFLFAGSNTEICGQSDFGSQIEDMEALNRYMRTTVIVNWPAAGPYKESFIRWWDNLSWHSKNLDSAAYDQARTAVNKFNLANVKTEAERANVTRVITTGITTEEMQGKKRPPILSTGEVGTAIKQRSTTGMASGVPGSTSSGPTAASMPTIRKGSSGDAVIRWQQIIGAVADGKFGPNTETATKAWQSSQGLTADGVVGPKTWEKALPIIQPSTPSDFALPGEPVSPVKPVLRLNSKGPDVTQWQTIVGVKPPTGFFGASTVEATKAFQRSRGLTADGVVGPKTWEAGLKGTAPFAPSQPAAPFAPSTPKVPSAASPKTTPGTAPSSAPKATVKKRVAKTAVQAAGMFDVSKWPVWAQIGTGLTVLGAVVAVAVKNKRG
jgi:peptidoglycan hydrolase-like protein with peptidoglycan-binding domain